MIKVREITEHSWILIADEDDQKIGLLSEFQGEFILLAKDAKTKFPNKDEITKFFNEDIFSNVVLDTATETEYFVDGYPVKSIKPHEVANNKTGLPLYTKSSSSDVYHCAGYYCLMFPKVWVFSFCPKYATLEKYEYFGPYKTAAQAKEQLSILKKKQRQQ
jgi:hypothetical protein